MKVLYSFVFVVVYFRTVSGHGFRHYSRNMPPPRKDACYISPYSHVHAGETFVNRNTCEALKCVQKEESSTFEFLRKLCRLKGACIEPGDRTTDEKSCIRMRCTDSGLLESEGIDNECIKKREDKKPTIVKQGEVSPSKCSGCEINNKCIGFGKLHVFPVNGVCRRVRCRRNGKLSPQRPARAWKPKGNECVRRGGAARRGRRRRRGNT